ncbi:MAG: ferrous iron transport protein A [Clostridiales bacterium]|nr:ferrous iron transport protein A [Clostridiales bacterium]
MMPLTISNVGETSYIRKIIGKDDVRQHLAELGFVVGEPVTVVSKVSGNMILNVKGTRIALGQSMTNRIMI